MEYIHEVVVCPAKGFVVVIIEVLFCNNNAGNWLHTRNVGGYF